MHVLGFEMDLPDRGLRAVVVDDHGAVVRRFDPGPVAAATLRKGLDELSAGLKFGAVGVASDVGTTGPAHPSIRMTHGCRPGAAAVVAEAWVGAARGANHAICLSIGERVLAGILLDGTPWAGAHGLAGSAAWLALNPVERQDYRKHGSLAAEVSYKGIARRLAWRIQAGDHSAVLERAGDLEAITAAHVFEGARTGDGVSISVVRDTAKYIGMAVANLAGALDPEVIVLSGAVSKAGDLLLDPVRQECARRLSPAMLEQFRLEISPLGEDGVAIGAARLAALARA
jgi:predicted NBD/HSP70 family sugar kinase